MKLTGDAEDMHLLQFHTSKSIAKTLFVAIWIDDDQPEHSSIEERAI